MNIKKTRKHIFTTIFFGFLILLVLAKYKKNQDYHAESENYKSEFGDLLLQAMLVPGVIAVCQNNFGKQQWWTEVAQEWNARHQEIQKTQLRELAEKEAISDKEKNIADRWALKRVKAYFNDNLGSKEKCDSFSSDVSNGKYDY